MAVIIFGVLLALSSCSRVSPETFLTPKSTMVFLVQQDDCPDEIEEFAPGSGGFQTLVEWLSAHANGWAPNHGSFLQSLDRLSPDQIVVKMMLRKEHPQYGFVYVRFHDHAGQYRPFIQKFTRAEMAPLDRLYGGMAHHTCPPPSGKGEGFDSERFAERMKQSLEQSAAPRNVNVTH